MNTSTQLSKLPGLRRTPGLAEIEGLLELLSTASLLVEARNRRILLANARATELTAFTRAELSEMAFAALIEKLDEHAFWETPTGEPFPSPLTLRKRNKARVEVQATRLDLTPQGKWSVITLEEMHVVQQREAVQHRRAEMIATMRTISQALGQSDLDTALRLMLQAGAEITYAEVLGVYLQNLALEGQDFEIVRYAQFGPDGILPERLPSQDQVHLRGAQFWTPAKRSASTLHRAARGAGLSFLASAPLGQANASIGFIAVAGKLSLSQESIFPLLQILADAIDALLQFHSRASSLETSLDANRRMRAVDKTSIDAVEDGVIVLSPTLRVLRLNPAAEQALGYTSQEANGHPVENILIGTGALISNIHMALQGVPTLQQDDIRLYRRSGQPFLAQVGVVPAMTQGQLEGVVVLIRDLSEKEQIQGEAEQLKQRAILGEVAAIFAHEVRNPINNISTGLQVMAYNLPPDDPHQDTVARLQQDCERLDGLMKTILTFARPAEFTMEPVDLGQLVSRVVERIKPRMVRANIEPFLQVEPSLPMINGNPLALEQVFINLINNAIEAMKDKGGTVALKLHTALGDRGKSLVEVDVADTGPGIPIEIQERIFQPFFTTKPDGNGLGLVITRRILNSHKGAISLASYPGTTVFHVQFPVMETT